MFLQAGLPTSDSGDSLARGRRAAASGWASLEDVTEKRGSPAKPYSSTSRMVTSFWLSIATK